MSGHSKWSTIKRQKGTQDSKRGQLFTKLSNAITVAVKQGGGVGDIESNFKLRLIIDRARAANMPKENIERAIEKAKGKGADTVEELLYEGFAPGGVAVIMTAVTDNKQRTFSTLKNIFDKNGGTLGSPGSVAYMFTKKGEIQVKKGGSFSSDDLLNFGIEAGADDFEEQGEAVFYYTDAGNLQNVKKSLEAHSLQIESAQLVYVSTNPVAVATDVQSRVLNFISLIEDQDDIQDVYTNLE